MTIARLGVEGSIPPDAPTRRRADAPTRQPSADESLRQTARQLEAVFVHQLLSAMRSTVTDNPLVGQGQGERVFTDMFDQQIAELAPSEWSGSHSIADALYRQLRLRLSPSETSVP